MPEGRRRPKGRVSTAVEPRYAKFLLYMTQCLPLMERSLGKETENMQWGIIHLQVSIIKEMLYRVYRNEIYLRGGFDAGNFTE